MGFPNKIVAADLPEAGGVVDDRVGGQGNDRPVVPSVSELPGRLVPVHDWHLHVHEHPVERSPGAE